MSMIRKYHNHILRLTRWHREEELLNLHKTLGRQIKQSNQLSLPHQVFCMLGYMASTWQFANKKKRPIILVMQSNIASKPSTWMPRYTTTENKQLASLRAVEFVSLVYIQCKTNLEASEHAFSEKNGFSDTDSRVFILTLAKLSTS